jgi:hypothetical protein
MDDFAKGKPAERQPYFEETAARRNSTTTAVEKDFSIYLTQAQDTLFGRLRHRRSSR